jgi:hypothetical protein
MDRKNWKHWTLVAIIAIFGIVICFTACDNGNNNTKICECPNGTIHLVGETCCEGEGCNCEKGVVGSRTNVPGKATSGIAVTNRGVSDSDFITMVGKVETALTHAILSSDARQNFIKNNIKEMKIFDYVNGLYAPYIEDGVLIIENNTPVGDIILTIEDWCDDNGIS